MSSEVFLPFLLFSMTFKKCYFPLFFLLSFLNLPQAREAVRVSWCRKCLLWRGPNKCEFVLSLNLSVRMQYLPLLLHLVLALVLASLPPHSPLCFFFFLSRPCARPLPSSSSFFWWRLECPLKPFFVLGFFFFAVSGRAQKTHQAEISGCLCKTNVLYSVSAES